MRGRKSIYRKLWKRWLIIEAVSAVICLILAVTGSYMLWLVVWLLFSFISDAFWGPGVVRGRAVSLQKEREKRLAREFNESWERANPEWVAGTKRRMNWIRDMKELAIDTYEDNNGDKMYVIPDLTEPIPLDLLEDWVENEDWKESVDLFVDWEELKEEYPWIDTFSDYDRKGRSKIDREMDDLFYGRILNEGGKTGSDYRVVPSDVRPWFPPYTAIDGLITVHEDTDGVGGSNIGVFDTTRGDWDYDDDDYDYDDDDYDYDDYDDDEED